MKRLGSDESFFSPAHADMHRDFGFHGSVESGRTAAPPFASDVPTHGSKSVAEPMDVGGGDYAKGGGVHPHGHRVVHVEHRADGGVVMHHAHGGHTVCHAHGGMTHHLHDGSPAHGAMGSIETMHDSSEYAHGGSVDRGDVAQDKAMIKKAVMQHENHEHAGEHTDLHLRRGGLPMPRKAMAAHHRSPMETPPRNPNLTTTPRNEMSGGVMPYGVEPSAEPDAAGSDQGIPQMKRGGRHKMRA